MGKTLILLQIKRRIYDHYKLGVKVPEICELFDCHRASVFTIVREFKIKGHLDHPKSSTGSKRKTSVRSDCKINRVIQHNRFASLLAIKVKLEECGIELSIASICRRINEFDYNRR